MAIRGLLLLLGLAVSVVRKYDFLAGAGDLLALL